MHITSIFLNNCCQATNNQISKFNIQKSINRGVSKTITTILVGHQILGQQFREVKKNVGTKMLGGEKMLGQKCEGNDGDKYFGRC